MQFEKYYQRLTYIHQLISKNSTGTPDEMAKKFGVSRRMLFEYLNILKEKDAPIEYSRIRRSYFYTHDWELENILSAQ